MSFLVPSELDEFIPAVRGLLRERISSEMMRAAGPAHSAFAAALWEELAALGVFAAALPEEQGGLGFGLRAAAAIIQEHAAALSPLPIFETVGLAQPLVLAVATSPQRDALLSRIASGAARCTAPVDALRDPSGLPRATGELQPGGACTLSGFLPLVPSVPWASDLVVPAFGEKGALILCHLTRSPSFELAADVDALDLVRRYQSLELKQVPAISLGGFEDPSAVLRTYAVVAAAEIAGCGRRVLEMTVEYVKTRKQFGAAIGTFQAIQHKLADVLVAVESAEALVRVAAATGDEASPQFADAAAAAKAFCSDAIPLAIEQCLQAHGGIGFTYEYDLHLWLRRAQMMASLFGLADENYRLLAQSALTR